MVQQFQWKYRPTVSVKILALGPTVCPRFQWQYYILWGQMSKFFPNCTMSMILLMHYRLRCHTVGSLQIYYWAKCQHTEVLSLRIWLCRHPGENSLNKRWQVLHHINHQHWRPTTTADFHNLVCNWLSLSVPISPQHQHVTHSSLLLQSLLRCR